MDNDPIGKNLIPKNRTYRPGALVPLERTQ